MHMGLCSRAPMMSTHRGLIERISKITNLAIESRNYFCHMTLLSIVVDDCQFMVLVQEAGISDPSVRGHQVPNLNSLLNDKVGIPQQDEAIAAEI